MIWGGLVLILINAIALHFLVKEGFEYVIPLCILFIMGGAILMENSKPQALDVYRGKTTLEITYRDSVAVDSVVVYKAK